MKTIENKNTLDVLYTICTPKYVYSNSNVASDLIRCLIDEIKNKNEYLRQMERDVQTMREEKLLLTAMLRCSSQWDADNEEIWNS